MRVRKKLALCVSVMGLWNGIEDNTLKALKKYWISAVWASCCQIECFLISFSVSFLSVCLSSHINSLKKCAGGEGGRMKRNQTFPVPVRLHAQIYWFHPPPPTVCSFSVPLNLSLYLSPPSPFLPQNSILYLQVMESSSAVLYQAQ